MNFNLKQSSKKSSKGKSTLSFGLNNRKNKKGSSILLDDDDNNNNNNDDDESYDIDNNNSNNNRKNVNRELAAEQEALRKRAEKAISEMSGTNDNNNIYDYDGNYESFSSGHHHDQQQLQQQQQQQQNHGSTDPKESRYIATLMKKAKERKQERDIIMERKIAREQEAEGLNDEYLGKDKFVTKAYKRVLEERESWLENEKKQSKIEEEEDVTKKKGLGVMGFYSNFDVAISGSRGGNKNSTNNESVKHINEPSKQENITSLPSKVLDKPNMSPTRVMNHSEHDDDSVDHIDDELQEQTARAKIMQKIFDARDRYLKRIGEQ